ncbi:MAG: hypothetical protein KAJ58_01690 [Candidatus Pacebacteria bacterium]|nr:hypothetical protein [Candidatus Paceibacterota bacterium]
METLSKLFGNAAKVKIMRLFLSNEDIIFDNADISKRTKVSLVNLRKELKVFENISLIKKRVFYKEITKKVKGKEVIEKKKTSGWILDTNFSLLAPLKNLLIKGSPVSSKDIIGRLKGGGSLKLIITSGVFIQEPDSRVDILIVGDNINNSYLERAISILESEIGQELKYFILETPDFNYRLGVYDKLLRDILDYSHKKIVNKLDF